MSPTHGVPAFLGKGGPSGVGLVKICGLTRTEDAALAARLGAWAVGFVLAPSPRRVVPGQVPALIEAARTAAGGTESGGTGVKRQPLTVGVFVGASPEEIGAIVAEAGLDAVQLHGPEPRASAVRAALGRRSAATLIIQAVPVPAEGFHVERLAAAVRDIGTDADLLLFDTQAGASFGGTGALFPWALARDAAGSTPFPVGGGLGPHNVEAALNTSGAVGVDVSSGVELSPGIKDPGALRALFAALRYGPARPSGCGGLPAENRELSEGRRT